MAKISNELIDSLKTLGLTEYEAKVYSALVLLDRAEAKQVYEYLEMPKPSVYQSLKTLTDKGLVQVVNARPAIYRATAPEVALRHMTDVHRRAEDTAALELDELEKARSSRAAPDVIWSLFGRENVEHQLEEMFERASRGVKAVLPGEYIVYLGLVVGRGFPAEVITFGAANVALIRDAFPEVHAHDALTVDLRGLEPLLEKFARLPVAPEQLTNALAILVDDAEMMYIPPIPGPEMTGFTSKNPFVVTLTDIVFGIIWERTK